MPAMRCKKCGAVIIAEEGKNTIVCRFCGTMQVVSNDGDKQKRLAQRRRLAARAGRMIAAGDWHSIGLKSDGTVMAVGADNRGQCRTRDWTDIVAISAGQWHTVGLKADGTVIASELTFEEQMARNCTFSFFQRRVENWKDIVAIAAGNCHTVGLKKDGSIVIVGYIKDHDDSNSENNLAYLDVKPRHRAIWFKEDGLIELIDHGSLKVEDGKIVNEFKEFKFSDGTVVRPGDDREGLVLDMEEWTDIVAIAAGECQTVGLKANGTVVALGYTQDGACDTAAWRNIVAIAAGGRHTIGLKDDGTVVAVGKNGNGACDVSTWQDIVAVAGGWDHSVGLKANGTVVAVGSNEKGQCNTDEWKNIVAIAAGHCHTIGLCADGTLVATGDPLACNISSWKLFDSIDTLDQELETAEKARQEKITQEQAVIDSIKTLCEEFLQGQKSSTFWETDKLRSGLSSELDTDDIYLAYDNSGLNYGEIGFAITRLGIYFRSPKEDNHVDFKTLAIAKEIKKKGGGKIYADDELIGICTKGSMSKALIKLFTDIAHAASPIAQKQAPTKAKPKKRVKLPLLMMWPIFTVIMLVLIRGAGLNNAVTQLLAAVAMAGTLEAIIYRIGPGWFLRLLFAVIGGYAGLFGWLAIIDWADITPPVGIGMIIWFAVVIDIVIGKYKLTDI